MIINIFGEDNYRSYLYLQKMIEKFKTERDPQGYNVVFVDALKDDVSKILSEMMSVPFLAEKRMIIVKNILSSSDKDLLSALIVKIKDNKLPESNIILFYQVEKLGRVKEIKELDVLLRKEKFSQEFEVLSGAKLSAWVKKEIEDRGGKISNLALNYLSQNSNSNWEINNLIDQVIAYKAGQEIEVKDLELFLDVGVDNNIFNMTEAVAVGDKKTAYKLLNKQRDLGEDENHLFLMILRQFRILIILKDFFDNNPNVRSDEAGKILGLHPFVIKKSLGLVKKYNFNNLKRIYNNLLDIDIKTKTGLADPSLLMDLFIESV